MDLLFYIQVTVLSVFAINFLVVILSPSKFLHKHLPLFRIIASFSLLSLLSTIIARILM